MAMTRFHALAIAAGLLLAVSQPSFAAKRGVVRHEECRRNLAVSRSKSKASAIRPYSRDQYPYGREEPVCPRGKLAR